MSSLRLWTGVVLAVSACAEPPGPAPEQPKIQLSAETLDVGAFWSIDEPGATAISLDNVSPHTLALELVEVEPWPAGMSVTLSPQTLTSGGTAILEVSFASDEPLDASTTVGIMASTGELLATVPVRGQALGCPLRVEPNPLVLPEVVVGEVAEREAYFVNELGTRAYAGPVPSFGTVCNGPPWLWHLCLYVVNRESFIDNSFRIEPGRTETLALHRPFEAGVFESKVEFVSSCPFSVLLRSPVVWGDLVCNAEEIAIWFRVPDNTCRTNALRCLNATNRTIDIHGWGLSQNANRTAGFSHDASRPIALPPDETLSIDITFCQTSTTTGPTLFEIEGDFERPSSGILEFLVYGSWR